MEKTNTKELVKKYGFRFTKSLGQNFLTDETVLTDIIEGAEICKDDFIIEIGPGVGTLTKEMLKIAKSVCAIELDSDLVIILNEELKEFDNFELIHKDALKVDFNSIIEGKENVKLVANLPYYITTPIVVKLLTEKLKFKSLTIMIQKEVGERMASEPNCKNYGSLSVLVQYYCDAKIVRKVAPSSFIPQPKVDSIVIRLDKLDAPRVSVKSEELFFSVVKHSFLMRRKTLWNSLKNLKVCADDMEKAFNISGIDQKRRGETLSLEEFAKLSNCIYDLKK